MHPLVLSAIIFAALCVVVVPLWFLVGRKKAREKQSRKRITERDLLRRRVHAMRGNETLHDLQYLKNACSEHGLEYEDIGTHPDELEKFRWNAHLNAAMKLLEDLRRNNHEPLTCIPELTEHLRKANHAYDWKAIGTTWVELRDLHYQALIARARARRRAIRGGENGQAAMLADGQLELLLILANATIDDLYPAESTSAEKAS
ncbi:MAG: hypothetical protein QY323_03340 [Patescibacteria group bacterium]|nr:MAG: hypothetical protein QY323_03340 [Patescibacteria group bacterium]